MHSEAKHHPVAHAGVLFLHVEMFSFVCTYSSYHCAGVLLSGQKGCGKTHIAHSVARHTGLVVHALSAADVVKSVSGAGLAHAETFWGVVAATAPCVVLLDDCELLAPVEPATPFQVTTCQ